MSGWPYNEEADPRDGETWEADDDRREAELQRSVSGLRRGLSIAEHAAMLRVHEDDDGRP